MVVRMKNEQGQAIFEFVVFIPFFLVLFTIFVSLAGSINSAINQQKATRGYFFYSIKGNSMLPPAEDLLELQENGVHTVGMYAFGWRKSGVGKTPYAPCYKLQSFQNETIERKCEDAVPFGEEISSYIKVMSVFGVCSATYTSIGDGYVPVEYNSSVLGRGAGSPRGKSRGCENF
jgi:hypothetical protein